MPATAIQIERKDLIERLIFMTVPREDGYLDVDIYLADGDFMPIGKPSKGASEMNEEDYHKKLREQAHTKGQFISDYSTNPEWNPEGTGINPDSQYVNFTDKDYTDPITDITHGAE